MHVGRTVEALKPQHRETKGNRFPAPDFPSNFSSLCCSSAFFLLCWAFLGIICSTSTTSLTPNLPQADIPEHPRANTNTYCFLHYVRVLVENMYMYAYHQHVFIDGIIWWLWHDMYVPCIARPYTAALPEDDESTLACVGCMYMSMGVIASTSHALNSKKKTPLYTNGLLILIHITSVSFIQAAFIWNFIPQSTRAGRHNLPTLFHCCTRNVLTIIVARRSIQHTVYFNVLWRIIEIKSTIL